MIGKNKINEIISFMKRMGEDIDAFVRRCINTRVMGASKDNLNSCEKSFVNGTSDREAHPKRWIAVLVQVNCEKKTATFLK